MRAEIHLVAVASFVVLANSASNSAAAGRQMEHLGRGVVAIHQGDGKVFVSWRVLGTDPAGIAFNLYRAAGGAAAVRLNPQPLTNASSFTAAEVKFDQPVSWFVRPVLDGKEQEPSAPRQLPAHAPSQPWLSIPLQTPAGYTPNDASVGDLDGDGEYEIVLHQAGRGRDNSQAGQTDPPILQAYKLNGTLLWTIQLGRNIREGAHYTQFMVNQPAHPGFYLGAGTKPPPRIEMITPNPTIRPLGRGSAEP